jgi:uncharacterized membrane protein YccC
MNYRTKNILIGLFLIIGLSAILKFYFKTPNIGILFLVVFGGVSGLTTLLVRGFINPPSWLYRIRFAVQGVFYGIFIGILLFGRDAIEKNTFNVHDLLVEVIIGSVIGIVFNYSQIFIQSQKLKRRKGLFLPERQLVKDSALLIKQNGEKIKGKLVLTNDHLIFFGNMMEEKILEREVDEIHPNISKTKFLGIPDGFGIENDDTLLKVPFPYYWLKSINKSKK